MKIAIVHDYLREYGGAERVLEALHQAYPQAPVYVGFFDRKSLGDHASRFADWDIRQTWIAKLPFYKKLYSPYRIFAPKAFASLNLSAYDVVISSSNAYFAKNIRIPLGKHLCYCHTPPRALYGYSTMSDWKANPLTRIIGTVMNHFLRIIDYESAQKVDTFIANSAETARRIKKFYRRDSMVINPPVAMVDFAMHDRASLKSSADRTYYLYVNRLALAKHPEIAIQVCTQLKKPLKVVGDGKMLPKLKEMAGDSIEFLGPVADDQLRKLYAGALALIYPVEDEDFGIVPIEAMAFGTPVIAHRSGGPMETIVEGKTGLFVDELSVEAFSTAVRQLEKQRSHFSAETICTTATKYSLENFQQKIEQLVSAANSKSA